jgi:hypothetical protein
MDHMPSLYRVFFMLLVCFFIFVHVKVWPSVVTPVLGVGKLSEWESPKLQYGSTRAFEEATPT